MKKENVYTQEDLEKIKEKLIENYKNVYDPEIPVNIYDLGLIYTIDFSQKDNYLYCKIVMTLTSPACPVAESLIDEVKYLTKTMPQIDEVEVEITFNPPWDKSKMSEDALEIFELESVTLGR
ncbi:MAG: metal-sulfur cluster assembly factor [Candidatus Marinarcus sp.]|uniref:metal-sulfur cluster assembly factor n=1 Tax=Candidatus Marinarcus sp. TaxID=3100987 RepID=UPI003AFF8288